MSDFGHLLVLSNPGGSVLDTIRLFSLMAMSVVGCMQEIVALYASRQARGDATGDATERDRPRPRLGLDRWRDQETLPLLPSEREQTCVWPFRCPRAHLLLPANSLPLARMAVWFLVVRQKTIKTTGMDTHRQITYRVEHAVDRLHATAPSCRSTPKHNESTVPSTPCYCLTLPKRG